MSKKKKDKKNHIVLVKSMDKKSDKRFHKIAKHYKKDSRLTIMMEECAELIQAANKYRRAYKLRKGEQGTSLDKKLAKSNLTEECADVLITIFQVIDACNLNKKELNDIIEYKVHRQEKRIKHGD